MLDRLEGVSSGRVNKPHNSRFQNMFLFGKRFWPKYVFPKFENIKKITIEKLDMYKYTIQNPNEKEYTSCF